MSLPSHLMSLECILRSGPSQQGLLSSARRRRSLWGQSSTGGHIWRL